MPAGLEVAPAMARDKDEAQARADQVRAFRAELEALEREGIAPLTGAPREAVAAHHDRLLASLAEAYDVDVTGAQKRLSWGMRIVAFLGAAAISAAVFFLFYRYWGYLDVGAQVAALVSAPFLALAGVELAARRDRTGSIAAVVALVAFACFVLDLSMLGQIFSISPSHHALLVWAGFAFLLAYGYDLRLLQIAGILCLLGWLSATAGTWRGLYWLSAGQWPEHFFPAGAAIFALAFVRDRRHPSFAGAYRLFGLLAVLLAVLVLAHWGEGSLLPLSGTAAEHLYQVTGFVLSGLAIWAGLRFGWPGIVNLGATSFAVFLYTRFYDWWWRWMPRYLFFLLVGLSALLCLLILKRLRSASAGVRP
jgi:uncharacterized membrane protein